MLKVSIDSIEEEVIPKSPGGRFGGERVKDISIALGRQPTSTDLRKRHPFDFSLATMPPKSSACPYHAHSAQWEMYVILKGSGIVRASDGRHDVRAGDVILFPPGEAHELSNESDSELSYYIIADNPFGDSAYFPDSDKWSVKVGDKGGIIKGNVVDYLLGEEPDQKT